MKGRKLILLAMVLVLLLAIPTVVFARGKSAKVTAEPPAKIEAKFKFEDKGEKKGLTIKGTAKGLEPFHTYRSLLCGNGSKVKGVHAREGAFGLRGRMFVGFWVVDNDGIGTLGPVTMTGDQYVELKDIGTISVRAGGPNAEGGAARGPAVVACGEVK